MRVAGELVVAVHAPEEEAEDDLADAVARAWSISLIASNPAPRTNSVTSTFSRESAVTTSGTTMNGCPRKIRASERWCWASSS